jgi:transposase
VLGYEDEVWWSRLAQPSVHSWSEAPMRLLAKALEKGDTRAKAIACYGLVRVDTSEMLLRFVDGRPVSAVTTQFLEWVCGRLAAEGKRVFVLVWDNAAWHVSQQVRRWIREYNRRVKREGGVRILECRLPIKSPWLNPIEPRWVHGKRAIVEPERVLSADELESRVCDYFDCPRLDHLQQHPA